MVHKTIYNKFIRLFLTVGIEVGCAEGAEVGDDVGVACSMIIKAEIC